MLRQLRRAAGLSLMDAEDRLGVSAVVLGSYERGDRNPPLYRIEQIFNAYGYTVAAVPINDTAVRLPVDMVLQLRAIADQLERRSLPENRA